LIIGAHGATAIFAVGLTLSNSEPLLSFGGLMARDDPKWWPRQLQEVFAAIGAVMGDKQLRPDMLEAIQFADFECVVSHASGAELRTRKGIYYITGKGGGSWSFTSGELQKLARKAAVSDRGGPQKGH
jgi:hypothetical protein